MRVAALGVALVVPGSDELVGIGVEQAVQGYQPKLATSAGEVTLKVPELRQLKLETAIIQRYKRARVVPGLSTEEPLHTLATGSQTRLMYAILLLLTAAFLYPVRGTMGETWTNLTFHGVGEAPRGLDRGEAEVWLSRDAFLGHLDAACANERVLITFDDGNLSDFEICLPALVDRGINGIFFVIAGWIGKPGYLGRDHIRALVNAGMEVGSHGMEHRPWRRLDQATMHHEIVDAKQTLEEVVGRPIVKAACPFGAYDRRSLSRLRGVGMKTVFTSDGGSARAGQWLQARHTLHRSDPADLVTQLVTRRKRPESLPRVAKRLVKRWR